MAENTKTNEAAAAESAAETAPTNAGDKNTAEDLAGKVLEAVNARLSKAEGAGVKDFAKQYGMTEDEAKTLLAAERDKKAAELPETAQKAIDEANQRADDAIKGATNALIKADVIAKSVELGIVDANDAFTLMDKSGVSVENGVVSGVNAALTALIEAKPHLKKQAAQGGTGSVGNFPRKNGERDFMAELEAARKAGDTVLAVNIKTEAFKNGINLR